MSEISNISKLPIDKESIRISAVRKLQVLDSQFEVFYQAVTKLAATISDAPVAMITFVDDQTIWIKSAIGVPGVTQVPRKDAFCGWVVTNDEYLEVPNTTLDSTHACHPLVTDSPNFMFYAGVPIKLPLGEVIGALCVFDIKPNAMSEHQKKMLVELANVISKALVMKNHLKH
ncbi:MAG: GAF domain-containing protein [Bacteroidia bacterium]|nr:GAF domain-containing protein [Methylotenera sp.]